MCVLNKNMIYILQYIVKLFGPIIDLLLNDSFFVQM